MHVRRPFDWNNMQIECANSTSALHTQIRSTWAPSQHRQTQMFIAHSKWNSMLQLSSRMCFPRVFFSIIFKHRSNFMCAQTYWTCWVDSNAGWIIIIQQLHLMFEFHVENFTWKKTHTSLNRITHDQINAGKVISNAINFGSGYIPGLFAENGRFLILIDWFRTDALLYWFSDVWMDFNGNLYTKSNISQTLSFQL